MIDSRAEDLYHFLLLWLPQSYGELNPDELETRGLEIINLEHDVLEEVSKQYSMRVYFIFFREDKYRV